MRRYDQQEDSLWKAAFNGNAAKVRTLVRKFEPSKNRELFRDVLMCAVQKGHAAAVKELLAAGANPDQTDGTSTLLMNAAWGGHLDVVRALIEGGATVDRRFEGRTALEAALENNQVEAASLLKKRGARWEMPTLMHACQMGDLDRVKEAVAAGANIHRSFGPIKETPLMRAAGSGQAQVVLFLLQQGAHPGGQANGRTAIWHAATGGSSEVIDALVEAGADVNEHDDGCTVLMAAAEFSSLPVVKRLIELGADATAIDGTGVQTALDYARKRKNAKVVAYLTRVGATSAREPVHGVARAIAREFGGKPVSAFDGYLIKSRLTGFKCEFRIRRSKGSVEVPNLEFFDPRIREAGNAELIIGRKPRAWYDKLRGRWRGKLQIIKAIEERLGLPAYRSIGDGAISADAAFQFVSRHRQALKQLPLSALEELWFGATFAQFTWIASEFPQLPVRLRKFGALVQEVARQKRPSPNRDLDD